jgi:hypothetical protein
LKLKSMAKDAEEPLDLIRPAVAIALLWGTVTWAQVAEPPLEPVEAIRYEQSGGLASEATGTGARETEALAEPRAVSLRLAVGAGYDANVFRTEQDTDSDFFWEVRPLVLFNGWAGKHQLGLGYEGAFRKYIDFDTEDFFDHRIFANANLDLTRKLDANLRGQVWWGHDARGSPGARIVNPSDLDTWREHRVRAELVYGREITRAQIIPWVELSGIRYLNNNQSVRDFDRQDFRARGRWRFNPRFYGLVEGGVARIDHLDPSNDLDRQEFELLVGFGWQVTAKTSGEVLVGLLDRDFDSPSRGNTGDYNWDARIHWWPRPYSKVTAFTRRTSREDASGGLGTFLADNFGVLWRHAFTQRLELNANAEYTAARYDSPRRDDFWLLELGVTHGLTRWLDLGARYEYLGRRSNISGLDYDDHMFVVELKTGTDFGF